KNRFLPRVGRLGNTCRHHRFGSARQPRQFLARIIMSTEVIYVFGTQKTLETSGASCANGAIVQANDASYGVVADGGSYPDALFAFRGQFGTATSIEGKTIDLYARPL